MVVTPDDHKLGTELTRLINDDRRRPTEDHARADRATGALQLLNECSQATVDVKTESGVRGRETLLGQIDLPIRELIDPQDLDLTARWPQGPGSQGLGMLRRG